MEEIPQYKLSFIGDSGVGKSSIFNKFMNKFFSEDYQATIGLDFQSKNIEINNKETQLLLYDTAGSEKFRSLVPMYIRNTNIIILVYDISCKDSFIHLDSWFQDISVVRKNDTICCLIGNKSDFYDKRAVTFEEGQKFAEEHDFIFQEISAKTSKNFDLFMEKLFEQMKIKYKIGEQNESSEEEEENEENNNLFINKKENKCSLNEHKEIDAKKFCQECQIYMCNKCENVHSCLCKNHHTYILDKNINEIFTGKCLIKNHSLNLYYFCKSHNELCCAACISKIKGLGNGNHKDCDVCFIKKIKNEKKNKLIENIKYLENLSKTIEKSIKELKTIFEKVNKNKEELRMEIQKTFTNIRNIINNREDELLLEIENKFDELYFKEDIIRESEKLPNKIKLNIEKGQMINNEKIWKDKKELSSLINICINIENNIKDIDKINKLIENSNNSINFKVKFLPKEINEFLDYINNYGKIDVKEIEKELEMKKSEEK